jgi:hypothetical protein
MNKWLIKYFDDFINNYIHKHTAAECKHFISGVLFVIERFDRGNNKEEINNFYLEFKKKLKGRGIKIEKY